MLGLAFGKAGVIEGEQGAASLRLQFEPRDRIDAFVPVAGAPRLDDAAVGNQLDVTPRDHSAEARKRIAGCAADLGGSTAAQGAELLAVGECGVDPFGAGG